MANQLSNTDWWISTGTWKVTTDTINGEKVKVFECIGSGIIYIPIDNFMTSSEAAYGTFNWWFYKGSTSTVPYIYFISDAIAAASLNGYRLNFTATESIDFRAINNGSTSILMQTADDVVPIQTWFNSKITRRYDGQFSIYQDEVLVTAAAGTNPTTNTDKVVSNYILLDLDAGDKIAIADIKGDHSIVKKLGI